MATTADVFLGELNVGSTDRMQFSFLKDGEAWAGIDSVTLVFEKPDRATQFSRSMVLGDDATGTWYYDTTVDEIDAVGYWTLRPTVVDGPIVKRYPHEIGFHVVDEP